APELLLQRARGGGDAASRRGDHPDDDDSQYSVISHQSYRSTARLRRAATARAPIPRCGEPDRSSSRSTPWYRTMPLTCRCATAPGSHVRVAARDAGLLLLEHSRRTAVPCLKVSSTG